VPAERRAEGARRRSEPVGVARCPPCGAARRRHGPGLRWRPV